MITETALDWLDRYQSRSGTKKRRRGSAAGSSWHDDSSTEIHATDPSTAAWRFLHFGKSGIAPIDAVWMRNEGESGSMHLPPVTVLEGPKDVGKTWMLLTLAARFVVATRASRFKSHSNESDKDEECSRNGSNISGPKVLLLDSTYDFSLSQLANIVRLTLLRERQRTRKSQQQVRQSQRQQQSVGDHDVSQHITGGLDKCNNYQQQQPRHIEDELELQEREKMSLEQDMDDCLGRIHIIQVDNGPTGWVSILEALTYQLSQNRQLGNGNKMNDRNKVRSRGIDIPPAGLPTLLLWDGFLSDMSLPTNAMMAQTTSVVLGESIGNYNSAQALFDSPSTQELLIQLSRLLQKLPDSLWLVMTTRTVANTHDTTCDNYIEQSGIGLKLTEWIRKEEERRRRENDERREKQSSTRRPRRASYRIRLDRRHDARATGSMPSTTVAAAALFAKVVGGGPSDDGNTGDGGNRNVRVNDEKIPYSISTGGILS